MYLTFNMIGKGGVRGTTHVHGNSVKKVLTYVKLVLERLIAIDVCCKGILMPCLGASGAPNTNALSLRIE